MMAWESIFTEKLFMIFYLQFFFHETYDSEENVRNEQKCEVYLYNYIDDIIKSGE